MLAAAPPSSKGRDFWVTFPANTSQPPNLTLYLSSDVAASATVSMLGAGACNSGSPFITTVAVNPGVVTAVPLPSCADLGVAVSDVITNFGVHVTATQDITVYGINQMPFTTDSFLSLPTNVLGTQYYVMSYGDTDDSYPATEFALVAASPGTTHVTIIPSITTYSAASGVTHPAGVPYTISMVNNSGTGGFEADTYQLFDGSATRTSSVDLTGTLIQSDQPIAVFAGNQCAQVPNGPYCCCDHLVEEMTPVQEWGKHFLTVSLAGRSADTFRVMASQDNTVVTIDGAAVTTLAHGQFYETMLSGNHEISSCDPILVSQYANSMNFNNDNVGDPFEMLIPPYEQYLNQYTFYSVQTGKGYLSVYPDFTSDSQPFTNYVNVVAPTSSLGSLLLDGAPVNTGLFSPIGASGFSGAQLQVAGGSHTMSGLLPFGIFLYGWIAAREGTPPGPYYIHTEESYGNAGGSAFSPIATVASLGMTPVSSTVLVNTQVCLNAQVLDTLGNSLAGVRVDFQVDGQARGFAYSDSGGTATFCYSSGLPVADTVTASVACVSSQAWVRWLVPTPTITPTWSSTPTLTPSFTVTQTPSPSPTDSPTATMTQTFTITPTFSASPSITPTPTPPAPVSLQVRIYNSAGEVVAREPDLASYAQPSSLSAVVGAFDPDAGGSAVVDVKGTGLRINWSGAADSGQIVASGSYLVEVQATDPFGHVNTYHCQVDVVRALSQIRVVVYNAAGEAVRHADLTVTSQAFTTLALGSPGSPAGFQVQAAFDGYTVQWDGTNDRGDRAQSGTYIIRVYRLQNGQGTLLASQSVLLVDDNPDSPLQGAFAAPNPIPAGGSTRIWLPNAGSGELRLEGGVFSLAGERVGWLSTDARGAFWQSGRQAEGIYMLLLEARDSAGRRFVKRLKISLAP